MPPSPTSPKLASRRPSWLYPFKGMYYFLSRRHLHALLAGRLLPLSLLSIFVLTLLFVFAYIPQALFLLIFHSHLAWFNAAILVLGEGAAIIALLFEAFMVDEALVDTFDAVLVGEGLEDLVAQQRVVHPADEERDNPRKRLGAPTSTAVYSPFSLRQIVEFVVFLPLNLIPVVGVPVFLLLTGYRAGPLHHHRYFKLRDLGRKDRKKEVKRRSLRYTWFGAVAMALQLVPGLSMLFLLTSAAGSALWVVELETARRAAEGVGEEGGVLGEEAPPEYTDDPV